MSLSVNGVINNYTYTYQNKLRPKLDKNSDAYWTKNEIEDYAKDYKAATGTALDVDKLITDYDADGDGKINYAEQQEIGKNDALGLESLAKLRVQQSTPQPPSSGTTDSAALKDIIAKYTYSYGGKLYPKLDQNSDGAWNKSELEGYTAAYEKATGTKLDPDKILADYDYDKDGTLGYWEQEAIKKADALGFHNLAKQAASLGTAKPDSAPASNKPADNLSLQELLGGLSTTKKVSLSNLVFRSEQTSYLLNSFLSGGNNSTMGMMQLFGQQNLTKLYATQSNNWAAMSGSMMNMII